VRYQSLDSLRGCAIALMILFHFSFDLNHFQLLSLDFYHDPFWLVARALIVTLFLLLVGVSLELSARRGLASSAFRRAYGRRLVWLLLCAALVSISSYLMSPSRWIYFGILHFIIIASLLGLLFVGRPRISLWLGLTLILPGLFVSFPLFDHPALQWLGLMTHKPQTEDYVPLLPWFGVVLMGVSIGAYWFNDTMPVLLQRFEKGRRDGKQGRMLVVLGWAGRHSLLIYMLHQPILFGMLAIITGRAL